MCGLCGALGGDEAHWTASGAGQAAAAERRRQRAYRVSLVNRVLARQCLKLADFQGTRFVLASATGKRSIVTDLGGVWREAETLSGRLLDPLDPDFLEGLRQ